MNTTPLIPQPTTAPQSPATKAPYATPVLTCHGQLASLTQQIGVSGGGTDAGGTGTETPAP